MTTMELMTIGFWIILAFIIFGIGCLVEYLTNPKKWHEVVAQAAFGTVIAAAIFCVSVLNLRVAI